MQEALNVVGRTVQRRASPAPVHSPDIEPDDRLEVLISQRPTPLPILRILPLLLQRAAEGLTFTVIFPYINDMLLSFGIEERDLGFYAGLVESALMITEAFSAPLYAPLADRMGRRPVMLVLLVCWVIGGFGFGLCSSVFQAVLMRAWLGLLAGCGVISRTMIGEMCDKTNRIQGFAVFTPSLTVGMTLGPLLGGFLAKPVPTLLSPSHHLFVAYPYLLPAIVVSVVTALAAVSAYLFLTETLRPQDAHNKGDSGGFRSLIQHKPFKNVAMLYSINNGITFSWEAIYPLFAYTRSSLGGLGLPVHTIGIVVGLSAMLSIFMTAFVFPFLHRQMSEANLLILCLVAYPAAVFFFPIVWAASRDGLGPSSLFFMTIQMVLRRTGDFSNTLLDTIVLDAIPSPEHLAMANSLVFSTASVARAIGPFAISWTFGISTGFSSPWRNIVWVAFILSSIPSIVIARRMTVLPDHSRAEHIAAQYELMAGYEE